MWAKLIKINTNIINHTNVIQLALIVLCIALLQGCSYFPRNPVPLNKQSAATIQGIPMARAWWGTYNAQFQKDLLNSFIADKKTSLSAQGRKKTLNVNILALSGGGSDGAFGAGVLNGWTKTGHRPEFKIVTGISTGAIIAPFAFLGDKYDATLKSAYTHINTKNIYRKRYFSIFWNESLVDTSPLFHLIKRLLSKDVIKNIARKYRRGGRLYIGTTNLDADQLVIWNMGVIANSNHPGAIKLFRRIILASSSIPGVFPPVMFKVRINGKQYDEMHIDGGIKAQLFLARTSLNIAKIKAKIKANTNKSLVAKIYVIRNSKIAPNPQYVKRKLTAISRRALSLLIQSSGNKDLTEAYYFAKKHGFGFRWIAVPGKHQSSKDMDFNQQYMNRLFNLGYKMGSNITHWQKIPPNAN